MKIVCIGDSLTAAFQIDPNLCWVSRLEAVTPDTWVNKGLCGDTCMGMLARFESDVIREKPEMAVIMGGYNDILLTGSADQAKCCFMAMVQRCVHEGIKPVLGIPFLMQELNLPYRRTIRSENTVQISRDYLAWLRGLADDFSLRYLDFHASGQQAGDRRAILQDDGIHPTAFGHELMMKTVLDSRFFPYFERGHDVLL